MSSTKAIAAILGIGAAAFMINKISKQSKEHREDFGMLPSMTVRVQQVAEKPGEYGVSDKQFYSVPGQFQSLTSPRINPAQGYNSSIRWNLPNRSELATPENPISYGKMAEGGCGVKENYGGCRGSGPTPVGIKPVSPNYSNGDYAEVARGDDTLDFSDTVPVGDMTTINKDGDISAPLMLDRFIVANKRSKLNALGDRIRGDLAIAPVNSCGNIMFRPSVSPNIDLTQGAMQVMGGYDLDSANKLADLIYHSSGYSDTTIGGINMSTQLQQGVGDGMRSVNVTAFP